VTAVDQPALDDDVTARLFELSVQRVRGTAAWPLMFPLIVGAVAWMWTAAPAVAVACLAAGLVGTWQFFAQNVPGSFGWPAAARRMLSEQPWRELAVTVLDTRGTVVALPDGEWLRVYGLPKPAREVAVRTGRIWAVGPDRAGTFAVRVDGLHTPWPARRVSARKAEAATPGTEPIVTAWGRHLVERARGDLWYALVGAAAVAMAAVAVGELWFIVLAAAGGAVAAALAVRQLKRAVRLRDAGPWHRGEASVSSWTSRQGGVGDGTIALRFPDGHRYTVHLEHAPLDVFANAWREETLWLAPGGVVGFLDYPVAAFAHVKPEN
jgi:hypothetical protein